MGFLVWMSFAVLAVVGWEWMWQQLSQKVKFPWGALNWAPEREALAKIAFRGAENLLILAVLYFLGFQFNGAFFVLVGAIIWFFSRQKWSGIFLGFGLFLVMIERGFQMSSLVFTSSLHLPWLFVLGDSTTPTLTMIFLFGIFFGAALPWLWLHLVVGFLWYSMGLSSISVALILVASGVLGQRLRLAYQERKGSYARPYLYRFILSCLSLPLALVVASFVARPQELSERAGVFTGAAALFLLGELALSAVFFHFYSAWAMRRIKAHG